MLAAVDCVLAARFFLIAATLFSILVFLRLSGRRESQSSGFSIVTSMPLLNQINSRFYSLEIFRLVKPPYLLLGLLDLLKNGSIRFRSDFKYDYIIYLV